MPFATAYQCLSGVVRSPALCCRMRWPCTQIEYLCGRTRWIWANSGPSEPFRVKKKGVEQTAGGNGAISRQMGELWAKPWLRKRSIRPPENQTEKNVHRETKERNRSCAPSCRRSTSLWQTIKQIITRGHQQVGSSATAAACLNLKRFAQRTCRQARIASSLMVSGSHTTALGLALTPPSWLYENSGNSCRSRAKNVGKRVGAQHQSEERMGWGSNVCSGLSGLSCHRALGAKKWSGLPSSLHANPVKRLKSELFQLRAGITRTSVGAALRVNSSPFSAQLLQVSPPAATLPRQ